MDVSTKDILGEISVGCDMATGSMDHIMEHVQDENFLKMIHKYRVRHEELGTDAKDLFRKAGEKPPELGKAAGAFAWVTEEMKLAWNDPTKESAKLLMNGCNMGIQTISSYVNDNPQASQTSKDLAGQLIDTEEAFMQDLEAYV
jgi:hypothetical protein